MSAPAEVVVHATAVLHDGRGILITGASGAGKSSLALALLDDAARRGRDGALIGDDRVCLRRTGGRVVARGLPAFSGCIEMRGVGIVARPTEPAAVIALVVELGRTRSPRWPEPETRSIDLLGVRVARLVLAGGDPGAVARVRARLDGEAI